MRYTVTKIYRDFPAAHRQPNHDGHCRLIHGHNWGFDFTFCCDQLDDNGFIIDVGKLSDIKAWLVDKFDHTLLLNETDPYLKLFFQVLEDYHDKGQVVPLAKIVVVPNCGMEGLAKYVLTQAEYCLDQFERMTRGLTICKVVCWEDSKNSATFEL